MLIILNSQQGLPDFLVRRLLGRVQSSPCVFPTSDRRHLTDTKSAKSFTLSQKSPQGTQRDQPISSLIVIYIFFYVSHIIDGPVFNFSRLLAWDTYPNRIINPNPLQLSLINIGIHFSKSSPLFFFFFFFFYESDRILISFSYLNFRPHTDQKRKSIMSHIYIYIYIYIYISTCESVDA